MHIPELGKNMDFSKRLFFFSFLKLARIKLLSRPSLYVECKILFAFLLGNLEAMFLFCLFFFDSDISFLVFSPTGIIK